MYPDYSQEVDAGVALLEQHKPDWRQHIDPETLNLGSNFDCILGQVFEDFSKGTQTLGLPEDATTEQYGFDVPDKDLDQRAWDAYTELMEEWLRRL